MSEILKVLPNKGGIIWIDEGGDGVYLRFDCGDCRSMIPYCHAQCCALHGIILTAEEIESGNFLSDVDDDGEKRCLRRRPDGYCIYNSPSNHRCEIYKNRPQTCKSFHCTRGVGMRGWRLELRRQASHQD